MFGKIGEALGDFFVSRWRNTNWINRTLLAVGLLFVAFIAARLEFFGQPPFDLTKRLFPSVIPLLDKAVEAPGLAWRIKVHRSSSEEFLEPGAVCHSGEVLQFIVSVSAKSWISIFGIDQNGVYPIDQSGLSSKLVAKNSEHTFQIRLDDRSGVEIFTVVASLAPIDFDDDLQEEILPYSEILQSSNSGNSKGGGIISTLRNPEPKWTVGTHWCEHRS